MADNDMLLGELKEFKRDAIDKLDKLDKKTDAGFLVLHSKVDKLYEVRWRIAGGTAVVMVFIAGAVEVARVLLH